LKGFFCADGYLHRQGQSAQAVFDRLDGEIIRGTNPIHLVRKTNPGYSIAVRLPPDGLALRFNTLYRIKDHHPAIQHAQRALNLGGEVDMTGGIDDVDLVILPVCGHRGRHDRDPPLAFLHHPIRDRGAVINITQAICSPGVKQDPLSRRRFARVNMRNNANIAATIQAEILAATLQVIQSSQYQVG
jgi:hypothetical protein